MASLGGGAGGFGGYIDFLGRWVVNLRLTVLTENEMLAKLFVLRRIYHIKGPVMSFVET